MTRKPKPQALQGPQERPPQAEHREPVPDDPPGQPTVTLSRIGGTALYQPGPSHRFPEVTALGIPFTNMNVNQIVEMWGGYGHLDEYARRVDHTFREVKITFNPQTLLFRVQYVCYHGNSKVLIDYKPLLGVEESVSLCEIMVDGTLTRRRCPEYGTFVPLEHFYYENIGQKKLIPAQVAKYMNVSSYLKSRDSLAERLVK